MPTQSIPGRKDSAGYGAAGPRIEGKTQCRCYEWPAGEADETTRVLQVGHSGCMSGPLRQQMVAALKGAGLIRTVALEEAMLQVPRHLFVPGVDLPTAYRDDAVLVKRGKDGSPISSASQPTIVATMLEQLAVAPGHRVLEVGTGTGYNAALLATLVGADGHVTTVELEPDLAEAARHRLDQIGLPGVEVAVGDGRHGHSAGAPYDRVIITAGVREIAAAWTDQLTEGGRLVVPLVDEDGVGTIVGFQKVEREMERLGETPCGFLPLREPHESSGATHA
jgi:protein-L-isoaspartate(D-aspartate) O-methyltransferase